MDNYDAVVVGAGNGGLTAAVTLARKGLRTLLLERHNIPGGCATSFCRGRFEFEVALHQLSGMGTPHKPGPLRMLLNSMGVLEDLEFVEMPDLLLMMSDLVTRERGGEVVINPRGTIVYDESLVNEEHLRDIPEKVKLFKIPATQIAREHFRVVVANNVMMGFVCRKTSIIDKECIQAAILKSAPPGTEEMNISAFNKGYEWSEK